MEKDPDPILPVIILVKPQLPENIGMVARAMFNCGVGELRLVKPFCSWPSERAVAVSADSLNLMPEVKVFETLDDAIKDLTTVYASTARLRSIEMKVLTPIQTAQIITEKIQSNEATGIVFGCESSGLDNDDVVKCNGIINIPLNEKFTSLNLAQAVLLICWEFRKAYLNYDLNHTIEQLDFGVNKASAEKVAILRTRLVDELDKRGFFREENSAEVVQRIIEAMLNRINMNEQEVQLFHGMIRCFTNFPVKYPPTKQD